MPTAQAQRSPAVFRRAPYWSRPAHSPIPCWRAKTRATFSSTAVISGPATKSGNPIKPEKSAKPATPQVLLFEAPRRPLRQFLRRPASLLLRQRGQGHGRRQARLSGGQPRAREVEPAYRGDDAEFFAPIERANCAPPCMKSSGLPRTSSKSWCGPRSAAQKFQPGQFYRLQNFEITGRTRPMARDWRWKAWR